MTEKVWSGTFAMTHQQTTLNSVRCVIVEDTVGAQPKTSETPVTLLYFPTPHSPAPASSPTPTPPLFQDLLIILVPAIPLQTL